MESSTDRGPETIGIVSCGATKAAEPTEARHLYTSSTFRGALAAAEAQCDQVFIISALHGLISPDEIIEPYDVKMGDPGSITIEEIAAQARIFEGTDIYAFTPAAYFEIIDEAFRQHDIFVTPVFEATQGIGDQRKVTRICRAA
jgi:hypothetical protein